MEQREPQASATTQKQREGRVLRTPRWRSQELVSPAGVGGGMEEGEQGGDHGHSKAIGDAAEQTCEENKMAAGGEGELQGGSVSEHQC